MEKKDSYFGQDIKRLMDENDISVNQLAQLLKCSSQTIYAWRSRRYSNIQISQEYTGLIHSLNLSSDWESIYKKKLREFIAEKVKSVVFQIFYKNSSLNNEFFVKPVFNGPGLTLVIP